MSYGLKGNVKGMVVGMDALRGHKERPRNISLRTYIGENYKDNNGQPLTVEHLYQELGINIATTRFGELYANEDIAHLAVEVIRDAFRRGLGQAQREQMAAMRAALVGQGRVSQSPIFSEAGNTRFISPEVITDPVMRGAVEAVFYPDLIIREIGVGSTTITMPQMELSDAALADAAEGSTIEVGSVSYGSKDVKLHKQARGLEYSYESMEFNTLDLVALYFEDLGRQLGSRLNGKAVIALTDGDQADSSEAPHIVGVTDTDDGYTYKDILRVLVRLARLGRPATAVIGNEETIIDYLDIEANKEKQQNGQPLIKTVLKTPLPTQQSAYVSGKVDDDQLVFADSSSALVQLTARYLMLETEKIVRKQLGGTYASIITGFANFQRNARVILDKSVAFSATPWPTWMTPFDDND